MYIAGHKYGICQIHKSDRAAHSFIIDKLVLSIVNYSLQTVNYYNTSSIVTVFMHCKLFFLRLHIISARENETSKSKLIKVLVIMLSTLFKISLS